MSIRKDIKFTAYDGTTLAGDFYEAGMRRPCLIMTNGFSGLRNHFLDDFAIRFQSEGYGVLVYDNRCWGSSGGLPRNEVDPILQTRDLLDAFNYVCNLPEVDPDRIAYWGSSMSAGNAICAAAINKRVRAVIAQVPFVSGELAVASSDASSELLIGERQRAIIEKSPMMIPVFPSSKEELMMGKAQAVLKDPTSFTFLEELRRRGHTMDEQVTVQSLTYSGMHEPFAHVHRVSPAALLMIIADGDTIASTQKQLAAYEQALEPKRLHIVRNTGHFDLYFGLAFEENILVQLNHLKHAFS